MAGAGVKVSGDKFVSVGSIMASSKYEHKSKTIPVIAPIIIDLAFSTLPTVLPVIYIIPPMTTAATAKKPTKPRPNVKKY